MEEFFKNATTGYWWFSVVVVGVLINLASSFLEKRLTRLGSSSFAWLHRRSEKRRKAFQAEVARLTEKPELLPYFFQNETRWRIRAVHMLGWALTTGLTLVGAGGIMGAPLGALGQFVTLICALGALASMKVDDRADRLEEIVREARKIWDEQSASTSAAVQPSKAA